MPKKRQHPMKRDPLASAVVAALGGPTATARIFDIKPPSVMKWLESGIPPARLMYLDVAYPDVMRKARKAQNGDVVDRVAASDDTQPRDGVLDNKPSKGGRNKRNPKEARARAQ